MTAMQTAWYENAGRDASAMHGKHNHMQAVTACVPLLWRMHGERSLSGMPWL